MNAGSYAHIYGYLEGKPLTIQVALSLSKGIFITGYLLFTWYFSISAERREWIRTHYSQWLKNELATQPLKTIKFSDITEGLELSVSKATEGKITLIPN